VWEGWEEGREGLSVCGKEWVGFIKPRKE